MGRTRRYIEPGRPYELILRVKEGLPFRPGVLINTLLDGIMARAQRDHKVTICHYLWMSNHLHVIFIVHDPRSCVFFYQELQKKITDTYKRLLGKRRLSLWEGDPVLAQILDLDKAIDRVAYLYANPANANLVDSISSYPGASSWKQFIAGVTESPLIPWIQLPKLRKLPTLNLRGQQEQRFLEELLHKCEHFHILTVEPNALMSAFGVDSAMKEVILERIELKEALARSKRKAARTSLVTKEKLLQERIFAHHYPKYVPGAKRVFVLSSVKELRMTYISLVKEFSARCSHCYREALKGVKEIVWPQGAFRPVIPPMNN